MIQKCEFGGETLYLAEHCGELLTVVEDADTAKARCASHAIGPPETDHRAIAPMECNK